MTASAARQRKIISDYKYPREEEASARIVYYREARAHISEFHASGHDESWLRSKSRELNAAANSRYGSRRTRLKNNARALREYARHFSHKGFDLLPDITYGLRFGDVTVTVTPDLHVLEDGAEKFIKLGFSTDEPSDQSIKIICQGLYEAITREGYKLSSSSTLYYDVSRGAVHRGARMGARMAKNLEAACTTISDIWDGL